MFTLHPQLAVDTVLVGDFPLCRLLLSRDANYPWCILVPRRDNIREVYELEQADRQQLLDESCVLSEEMQSLFGAEKMNVAALGNMVPQLHVHHIARFSNDAAWPGPVWGSAEPMNYTGKLLNERINQLGEGLEREGMKLSI